MAHQITIKEIVNGVEITETIGYGYTTSINDNLAEVNVELLIKA